MAKVVKKKAKVEPKGDVKRYRLTEPHYRNGVLMLAGEFVEVPAKEKPGKSWVLVDADGDEVEEVDDEPKAEEPAEKPAKGSKKPAKKPAEPKAEAPAAESDTNKDI